MMTRRDMLANGAGVATLATLAGPVSAADVAYPEPALGFVFQADVLLAPAQELGTIDGMRRRIIPIIGGTVHGPRLQGEIMPGGADWQGIRPGDFLTRVQARYWLKAADGTVIGVENSGIRRAPAAVMQRLMAGEAVPPSAYYFRTVPVFEVGEGPHQWLNETMFVCVGARQSDRAILRFYAIS